MMAVLTQGCGVSNNHPIKNGKLQAMANGCLEYTGCRDTDGYGDITVDGKGWGTHQYTWTKLFGDIPKGMCVCHSCDNPPCVNPEHLWLGTLQDNVRDMDRKGRRAPFPRGEKNHQSKLTSEQVAEMRSQYPRATLLDLSERYGISMAQVSRIVRNEHWREQ